MTAQCPCVPCGGWFHVHALFICVQSNYSNSIVTIVIIVTLSIVQGRPFQLVKRFNHKKKNQNQNQNKTKKQETVPLGAAG